LHQLRGRRLVAGLEGQLLLAGLLADADGDDVLALEIAASAGAFRRTVRTLRIGRFSSMWTL
jgi:hypothetical protein